MDAASAARVLDRIAGELDDRRDDLADIYAADILERARTAAGGRPTPQARMAASGFTAERGAVSGAPGTVVHGRGGSATLADIGWGAERGSDLYPQFAPRREGGYWLGPAAEDDSAQARREGERELDAAIAAAKRGFG